jgi:hypothetical protein
MDTRIDRLDTRINRLVTAGYSQKQECHKYYREYSHGPHFTQLVNRVDYRHAITNRHITSPYRADGVGLYGDACYSRADARADAGCALA